MRFYVNDDVILSSAENYVDESRLRARQASGPWIRRKFTVGSSSCF